MSTNGGALDVEVIVDNGQLDAAMKETKRSLQDVSKTASTAGDAIDKMLDVTSENIEIQKGVIDDLKQKYKELEDSIKKMYPGEAQEELIKQALQVKQELTGEEKALDEMGAAVKRNAANHQQLRTQLINVEEELARMEQAGQRGTEAYAKLQEQAGRLKDAWGDAHQQAKVLADDNAVIQGVMSGITGLTGAISVGQGAISMFAGENANLQKIMVKIQSLMAITIGLQQVANTLNKDSYFRIVTLTRAKQAFAAMTARTSSTLQSFGVAAGVANTAATVLTATLTLGLSVAITAASIILTKFIDKQQEAKKKADEFNAAVAEAAVKPVEGINTLSQKWQQLSGDIKAQKKFIEDNKDKFDDYGVSVKNAADAENLLITNKQAFIDAQMAKAKAIASQDLATEKYKEQIQNQLKLEEAKKTPTVTKTNIDPETGNILAEYPIANPDIAKYEQTGKKIQEEIDDFYKVATESEKKGKEILTKAGIKGAQDYAEGTLGAYEKALDEKQKKLKTITNKRDYAATEKEIADIQKKIDAITGGTKNNKTTKSFQDGLNEKKALYNEYLQWMNSSDSSIMSAAEVRFAGLLKQGDTYEEYLKGLKAKLEAGTQTKKTADEIAAINDELVSLDRNSQLDTFKKSFADKIEMAGTLFEKLKVISDERQELEGQTGPVAQEKTKVLDEKQNDLSEQVAEDARKAHQELTEYYASKMDSETAYLNKRQTLILAIEKETDEKQKQILQNSLSALDYTHDLKQATDYDSLVKDYQSYEEKCKSIAEDYDEKIALAKKNNNANLVNELEKAKTKALNDEAVDELTKSDTYTQLFSNLDTLSVNKMIELRNKLEAEWSKLDLSPESFEALRSKLDEVTDTIEKKNPFAALADAINRYKKAKKEEEKGESKDNPTTNILSSPTALLDLLKKGSSSENKTSALKDMLNSISAAAALTKEAFDSVVNSLGKFGVTADDQTQEVLNDFSGMMSGAASLAKGIASGGSDPLAIIQGSIEIISNGYDLIFGEKDREAERAIAKHEKAVKSLQDDYTELQKAVENALGEDYYKAQLALITNLDEQIANERAMMEEEESKKNADSDKIDEYKKAIADDKDSIADIVASMREDILGSDVKSIADDLGDALVDAFAQGENAAEAFADKVKDIVNQIVRNLIIQSAIEKPLSALIQKYTNKWVDAEGNMIETEDQMLEDSQNLKDELTQWYADHGKMIEDMLSSYYDTNSIDNSTLAGAIQGASQESIDLLAGQTNAVRVNQVQSIDILRQQLAYIASIDNRMITSNGLLNNIYDEIRGMKSNDSRALGITG